MNENNFYSQGYNVVDRKIHNNISSKQPIPFYTELSNEFFGVDCSEDEEKINNVFFRGFFDRFGKFDMDMLKLTSLSISIDDKSSTKSQIFIFKDIMDYIKKKYNFKQVSDCSYKISCDSGLIFLERIYKNSSPDSRNENNYKLYETCISNNCERGIYFQGYYIIENNSSDTFNIPSFDDKYKYDIFFRGFFDRYGFVSSMNLLNNSLFCDISNKNAIFDSNQITMFSQLIYKMFLIYKIETDSTVTSNTDVRFSGVNAFDLLTQLYKNSDARYRCESNYKEYLNWATFGLGFSQIPRCQIVKADDDAVIPFKARASDVGYDLTIIKISKRLGDRTVMYDTGIKVQPDFGYYTKIVPRSSLVKSGYMLSNSIGIIDGSYTGTLRIVLTKVDDSMPDLKLPFTCCQLIIDRAIHYELELVTSIENTARGAGGFGSTN